MTPDQILIDAALSSWQEVVTRVGSLCLSLNEEQLLVERMAGRRYTPLESFLIDKTTDTYSLSKFQLFAISLVAFFGYVYVMLCHVLVQWQFSFPEIPDNYILRCSPSAAPSTTHHAPSDQIFWL